VTDFINLKIKSVKSFGCGYMSRMCVFIEVSDHTCMSICVYTIFFNKNTYFEFTLLNTHPIIL
jgi:hypothetical protein